MRISRRSTSRWSSSSTIDRRHAGGERAAHHRRLLGALELLEQREQPVEALGRGRARGVVGSGWPDSTAQSCRSPTAFQEIVDSLPSDWTDLEFDLRVQEDRYIDAAQLLVQVNAQPYSHHDWHWRILVAHQFGHAAAAPPTHGTLKLLDDAGIAGELVLRELRTGRVETTQMWGRPESVRQEFQPPRGRSSRGPRRRRSSTTCCSAPTCSGCCARPATRRGWPAARSRRAPTAPPC